MAAPAPALPKKVFKNNLHKYFYLPNLKHTPIKINFFSFSIFDKSTLNKINSTVIRTCLKKI